MFKIYLNRQTYEQADSVIYLNKFFTLRGEATLRKHNRGKRKKGALNRQNKVNTGEVELRIHKQKHDRKRYWEKLNE